MWYHRLGREKRGHLVDPGGPAPDGRTNPCLVRPCPSRLVNPDNGEGRSVVAPAPPFTSGFYFRSV